MQTVRLELLRPGPSDGHLISPLTQYIAICDENPPELLQLPYNHRTVLDRMARLRYVDRQPASDADIRELTSLLQGALSQLRGFAQAVNSAGASGELVHVRLVLNAAELALLPFEFAYAPIALGGLVGISVSDKANVVMTRETRHATGTRTGFERPQRPKLLFVIAAPGDAVVPEEAHCAALERAFAPIENASRASVIPSSVRVLRDATKEDIAEACAKERFDWVHVLAHGDTDPQREDRIGIRLHSRRSTRGEVVYGDVLASVISGQGSRRRGTALFQPPQVVSLAVCDGGNVGSVVYADASVAHQLHEKGIPLVVASQLPLSFEGSVAIVEALYTGLVMGRDPRELLCDILKRLYESNRTIHDWASLVAYASFPEEMRSVVVEGQLLSWRRRLDVVAASLESKGPLEHGLPQPLSSEDEATRFASLLTEHENFLDKYKLTTGNRRWAVGSLANAYKRLASLVRASARKEPAAPWSAELELRYLHRSHEHYFALAQRDLSEPWIPAQATIVWAAYFARKGEKPSELVSQRMQNLLGLARCQIELRQISRLDPLDRFMVASQGLAVALAEQLDVFGKRQGALVGCFREYERALTDFFSLGRKKAEFRAYLEAREICRMLFWWFPDELGALRIEGRLFSDVFLALNRSFGITLEEYLPDR